MAIFFGPLLLSTTTRRVLVGRALSLATAARLLPAHEAVAGGLETVRQAAAVIPGYGAPDLYFPEHFRGRWRAERRVYAVETPLELKTPGLAAVASEARQLSSSEPISYDVRFLAREGRVIADRAFNAESLAAAGRASTAPGSASRLQADWSPSNPNVLTLREGPTLIEFKVTRRASDAPSGSAFGTSEYERVADVGSDGIVAAVPLIQARRVEARYRWAPAPEEGGNVDTIESLERVSWFDPMQTGFADLRGASPTLVVKARVQYTRVRS